MSDHRVFTDGEVVVEFYDGTEMVESFEDCGMEMEVEVPPGHGGVKSITFRQTGARIVEGDQ